MPIADVFENSMKNKEKMTKDKRNGKGAKVKLFNKKNTIKTDDVVAQLQSAYAKITPKEVKKFSNLPLSYKTQKGLKENGFIEPTEIQRESIGFALQGCDILGAAKTGSGKTLAFLIPVLEKLFCKKWTRLDGTGALIITPTRELAYQIFETLRKVGFHHDFSAGLIIGGKDLKFETKRMDQCNIIICTPGRLLHHMDENPLFDCVNLQILILDEADRCLDLGFEETMNSIIANLPPNRQTLLFSATQTKSVRDLARLSLKSPKYISVHENSSYSTPEGLTQSYVVCELEDKLSMLWSFIKNHYKHKILVFLASCKQVKYTFEIFCQLRPGIALLALYGSLHQQKRMDVYKSFCNKEHAVLFATDIAARGLDFPVVNWVIQLDCPEDATTYIHRVGRTARYHKGGEALLVLLPSEAEAMLNNLEEKKIPINEIKVNPKKLQNPKVKIEAMLAKKPELKESAQRAFVSYAKSVFLMKDKKVFNVHSLNTDAYARSLGLVVSPRIRFLQKLQKNQIKKEISDDQSLESYNNKVKALQLDTGVVKSEPTTDSENDTSNLNSKNKSLKSHGKSSISNIISKIKTKDEIKSEPDSSESSEAVTDNEQEEEEEEEEKVNDKKNGKLNLTLSNVTVAKDQAKSKRFQTFNFGMDDSDSDDEILKIKRSDHALDDEDEEDLLPLDEPGKHKKKPVTKAAIAKRILKKNIVPNKKIVFTEEGQAVEDRFKQRVTELGKKYEEEGDGGGISLEEAQKVLREEDKIDRQLFKERIKMKHREERIKLKKLRKGKDSDEDNSDNDVEEAEVGSYEDEDGDAEYDSENENVLQSDDSEDPNTDDNGDDDDDEDDNASPSDSEDDHISSKNLSRKGVKRKQDNNNNKDRTKKFKNSKASLVQDEELALQLLMNRNR